VFGTVDITIHSSKPKRLDDEQADEYISRLVWVPEGFSITPRSPSLAPEGWGLPETEDGLGTPGGPARQVMISRYKHNKYPDALWAALNPTGKMEWEVAPLWFADYELEATIEVEIDGETREIPNPYRIGINDPRISTENGIPSTWDTTDFEFLGNITKNGYAAQLSGHWTEVLRERETEQWYCHRPQLCNYIDPDDEDAVEAARPWDIIDKVSYDIWYWTNEVREYYGRDPVFPPPRGVYEAHGTSIVYEMWRGQSQAHNDRERYRTGYQEVQTRAIRHGFPLFGENLGTQPVQSDTDIPLGVRHVSAWVKSPDHFFAMMHEYWDTGSDDGYGGYRFQLGFLAAPHKGGTASRREVPPYGGAHYADLDPPYSGDMATQSFAKVPVSWLQGASPASIQPDGPKISLLRERMSEFDDSYYNIY
jgi:hypothetical protein